MAQVVREATEHEQGLYEFIVTQLHLVVANGPTDVDTRADALFNHFLHWDRFPMPALDF